MSLELGDYEGSLASFKRSSELFSDHQPAFAATAVSGMAQVHAAAGQAQAGLEQDAAPWRWRTAAPTRAVVVVACARLDRATVGHREVALITCARVSPSSIDARACRSVSRCPRRFSGRQTAVWAAETWFLVELGRADEALEIAERARTRAFLDMLSARDTVTTQALTLEEMRDEIRPRDDGRRILLDGRSPLHLGGAA